MAVGVRADKYFNNQKQWDMYGDVDPVDLQAGLVLPKQDKWGTDPSCTERIEDNIRERFDLVTPDDGDE